MLARDHEQVAARGRVDVHEGDRALVLVARAWRGSRRRRSCRTGSRGRRPSRAQGTRVRLRPRHAAPDRDRLRATVEHLAAIDRPSASEGERAGGGVDPRRSSRRSGCRRAIEEERAHGTYWRPARRCCRAAGAPAGLAAARGRAPRPLGRARRGRRSPTTSPAARTLLPPRCCPHRTTCNVVAEAGDPDAARDARVRRPPRRRARRADLPPRGSTRWVADAFPGWYERQETSPQLMRLVVAGPALVGARRAARPRGRCARPARSCRSARALAVRRHRDARASCPAPTTTSPRVAVAARARAAAARASRSTACACCSSPPARRSRSWRACAASCAATRPRSPRERTRFVVLETRRLAGADPARGRGHDLRCATTRRALARLARRGARARRRTRCAAGCAPASPPTR